MTIWLVINGQTQTVSTGPNTTLEGLVASLTGGKLEDWYATMKGKPLDAGKTLHENGITSHNQIEINGRLRGGMKG